MKGFIEHFILENAGIERRINGDAENISVPHLPEVLKDESPGAVDAEGTVYVPSRNSLDGTYRPIRCRGRFLFTAGAA